MSAEALRLEVATLAAHEAGRLVASSLGTVWESRDKGSHDVVTEVDVEAERIVRERLISSFPHDGMVGEEGTRISGDGHHLWVVDPLDGTNNFILGLPLVGVAVGLFVDGEARLGVVHLPCTGTTLTYDSEGAYLEGVRTHVQAHPVEGGTVGVVVGYRGEKEVATRVHTSLLGRARRTLSTWAPTQEWALLASGRLSGVVLVGQGAEDTQVGVALAEAAGAVGLDLEGRRLDPRSGPLTGVVAHPDVAGDLLAVLRSAL